MKKLNKLLALCMALTMLLLCVPLTASAAESAYGPEDLRSIHGIDYNRITQKATGDSKSYPVELKMGDLTFNGELTGSHGLTYEELNKIINEVLKEKKLTVEQIQLVKALAANVGDKATEFWGAQVLEGLLSYLPMPEELTTVTDYVVGVNDVFAMMVDGELPSAGDFAQGKAKDLAAKAAETAIEKGFDKSKEYFKKIPWAGVKKIPLLGQIINTVKIGLDWQSNDKFDAYLKALEQKMADVNDFYSECSRRANKLAEEKGAGSYVIKFDKEKNYRTYNATFWGISNIMMGATLSGVLEGSNTEGVAGTYTGTLWLDVEMIDPVNSFANRLKLDDPLVSRAANLHNLTTDKNVEASLTRSIQGNITVKITNTSGNQTPNISGNLFANGDEIEFSLKHEISGHNGHYSAMISLSSTSIYSLYEITTLTHSDGSDNDGGHSFARDPGTVWKPLESGMTMTIEFGKK